MDDRTKQANGSDDRGSEGSQSAESATNPLVTVRYDPTVHNGPGFACSRSERIHNFFKVDCATLLAKNYCRVFVIADPDNSARILGFYTLSPGIIEKHAVSTQHLKRVMRGLPIPMIRIGFLGRDDSVPKNQRYGSLLLHDAALRIHLSEDITAWGLYLDPENDGLVSWYSAVGFKSTAAAKPEPAPEVSAAAPAPTGPPRPAAMYVPLKHLLPEISGLP